MATSISQMASSGALTGDELVEVAKLSPTVILTAATISFIAAENKITDSAGGWLTAGFSVNDHVTITGAASGANNLFSGRISSLTAEEAVIRAPQGDAIVDETEGATVTITKWLSRRTTAQAFADDLVEADVVGAASSVAANLASFADTSGKELADSGVAPSTDGTLAANSDALVPTQKATKTAIATALSTAEAYTDSHVVGLWDDRGLFDASVNAYPSSGGSGTAGAILKGDIYTVSVAGTLPTGVAAAVNDTVRALVDTPGNTQANWAVAKNNTQTSVSGNAGTATALQTARNIDGVSFDGTADITVIAPGTHAATSKATPVDADELSLVDSAASNVLKKLTWANLKATAKTYFDTLYQALNSNLTTIAGLSATTDSFMQAKSSAWASRTVAQVTVDLQSTGLVAAAVGFREVPSNSQSAAYTTVAADSGKGIDHPATDANARTFTIDSNANVAYPVGTCITFTNMTSQVVTIAITSDTLYLAGTGTTGSRSLAQYGIATARKLTTTTWLISGTGLT